jgi:hypothetical protein
MKMKSILAGAALAGVVWLIWPYYTAYSIGQAINDGDTAALESRVSWPSVRQGFKDDLNAGFLNVGQDKANPFAGLVAIFAPAVTSMIDEFVTPAGLAALIRKRDLKMAKQEDSGQPNRKVAKQQISGQPNERVEQQELQLGNVKYAFFTGPTSFLIVLGDFWESDDTRLEIMMQFQDFGWKITRVYLPVEQMLAARKE